MADWIIWVLSAIFGIAVAALMLYFVSVHNAWFRKRRMLLLALVAIFGGLLYITGYMSSLEELSLAGGIWAILMGLFSAGRVFMLEHDFSDLGVLSHDQSFRILFGVVMVLALIVIAAVVVSFFGYVSICRIRIGFYKLFGSGKRLSVFSDITPDALCLADDIAAKGNALIVFLIPESGERKAPLMECVIEKNYLLLRAGFDLDDIATTWDEGVDFGRIGITAPFIKQRVQMFLCGEEPRRNLRLASRIADKLQEPRTPQQMRDSVALYVIGKEGSYENQLLDNYFSGLSFRLIDEDETAVQAHFEEWPLIDHFRGELDAGCANGVLTAAIIGFTALSWMLIKEITVMGQLKGLKLRIIVADEIAREKAAPYLFKAPLLEECVKLEWWEEPIGSQAYFSKLSERVPEFDCCFVCADDSEINLERTEQLLTAQEYKGISTPIYVCMRDAEIYQDILESSRYRNRVFAFADRRKVFTEDVIVNDRLDRMAQAVHEYYSGLYNGIEPWSKISLFDKRSNRAAALHVETKLRSIGLKLSDISSEEVYINALMSVPEILENLSIGEHLRWNAFHIVNGWRKMDWAEAREATQKNGRPYKKDKIRKLHAALVSWDELLQLDALINDDNQRLDRELVYAIGKIVMGAHISK